MHLLLKNVLAKLSKELYIKHREMQDLESFITELPDFIEFDQLYIRSTMSFEKEHIVTFPNVFGCFNYNFTVDTVIQKQEHNLIALSKCESIFSQLDYYSNYTDNLNNKQQSWIDNTLKYINSDLAKKPITYSKSKYEYIYMTETKDDATRLLQFLKSKQGKNALLYNAAKETLGSVLDTKYDQPSTGSYLYFTQNEIGDYNDETDDEPTMSNYIKFKNANELYDAFMIAIKDAKVMENDTLGNNGIIFPSNKMTDSIYDIEDVIFRLQQHLDRKDPVGPPNYNHQVEQNQNHQVHRINQAGHQVHPAHQVHPNPKQNPKLNQKQKINQC